MEPLVSIWNVKKYFPVGSGLFGRKNRWVKAVNGVNFEIFAGETVGLVGESGCGKSTVGRIIAGLERPTEGEVFFEGKKLEYNRSMNRQLGRNIQMVFQDPYSSLNPRMLVSDIIAEPLILHRYGTKKEIAKRVDELLEKVGLSADHGKRYPSEFSGGQRQRIGIARALALSPKLIICDEPVSALDVSIQAQILNLLKELQEDLNLSYLFIAHGIQAVRFISDRVIVMYLGEIVEIASKEELFVRPRHPYTQALLSAVPQADQESRQRERIILKGELPSPLSPPSGCRFHTRCPAAREICQQVEPRLVRTSNQGMTACLMYDPEHRKQWNS